MIMTAQLLLSLSILIVVHEWGHFITARMFDIKVEKFYLFFDFLFPMANVLNFSLLKVKRGDTEFGIGWFPLGGYVKIAGMVDESMDKEQMKKPAESWEFRSKPAWQRLIVMMGGIIVNVFVGILIFIGLTYFIGRTYIPKDFVNENGGIQALELAQKIGLKTGDKIIMVNGKDYTDFQEVIKADVLLDQGSYYTINRDGRTMDIQIPGNFIENFNSRDAASTFVGPRIPAIVGSVSKKTIADRVGIEVGDRFVEVDGVPVTYQDEVITLVQGGTRDSISFSIVRNGAKLSYHERFADERVIGFFPKGFDRDQLASVNFGFGESILIGTKEAFGVIFIQLKAFRKIFGGEISFKKSLSGPIGMAQAFGTEWDWERFWRMTGLLSMVLAFMNFLPIPALDGGYVMFLLYEMISGKEPSEKFFETALKIGMAILLILMVFVFYNDIAKLFTGG